MYVVEYICFIARLTKLPNGNELVYYGEYQNNKYLQDHKFKKYQIIPVFTDLPTLLLSFETIIKITDTFTITSVSLQNCFPFIPKQPQIFLKNLNRSLRTFLEYNRAANNIKIVSHTNT